MSVAEPPRITSLPLPDPDGPGPGQRRPKVKKLRLLLIVVPLIALALISTVFGMMMAVASDLPQLENDQRFQNAHNSTLVDDRGREIGVLVNNQNLIYVNYDQIAPAMRHAIIAVEDKRFYTNSGVDLRGIGRAFFNDVLSRGGTQGGSTITQQFVKNALSEASNRTVFEKLREAALAYHLTRKWSKDKILTEYLNTIYFGNGAYGIESAARIYFGHDHPSPDGKPCGTPGEPTCASQLTPREAALLAGMVSNPSGYDPQVHWHAALLRRNLVLKDMLEQGYITRSDYGRALGDTAPPSIEPPQEQFSVVNPADPNQRLQLGYFNNWVRQQLVDRYGPQRVFRGGWRVRTTIDLDLQAAAENAVKAYTTNPSGPTAALVAIDNRTGGVRAMVGGPDYTTTPFNLATQGQRQPGSAFKPFVLAAALRKGISPSSLWTSKRKIFVVPHTRGKEHFVVNNFESNYVGVSTLARALTYSDNSVFADVGFHTGFHRISRMATAMGIRTPVSTNPAITLGGLKQGVTVLDMAHAYETLAHRGERVEGTLGAHDGGPVGIDEIIGGNGKTIAENKTRLVPVVSRQLADTEVPIMGTVVSMGTGTKAQIPGVFIAGKTGTTENYGDAWFVAFTQKYTVAVWVGYPNSTKSMKTDFGGAPVEGGTFPAEIWRAFMVSAISIDQQHLAAERRRKGLPAPTVTTTIPAAPATSGGVPATGAAPSTGGATATTPATGGTTPAPTPTTQATPPAAGTTTSPSSTGGASPGTGGVSPGTSTTP
jgi:penicillin-binding protein 1A